MTKVKTKARIITKKEADLIDEYAKKLGISRKEIATALDIDRKSYDNYLGGRRNFPVECGKRLYNLLGKRRELKFLIIKEEYLLDYNLSTKERNQRRDSEAGYIGLQYIRPREGISRPWVEAYREAAHSLKSVFEEKNQDERFRFMITFLNSFSEHPNVIKDIFRVSIIKLYDLYCKMNDVHRAVIISRLEEISKT